MRRTPTEVTFDRLYLWLNKHRWDLHASDVRAVEDALSVLRRVMDDADGEGET